MIRSTSFLCSISNIKLAFNNTKYNFKISYPLFFLTLTVIDRTEKINSREKFQIFCCIFTTEHKPVKSFPFHKFFSTKKYVLGIILKKKKVYGQNTYLGYRKPSPGRTVQTVCRAGLDRDIAQETHELNNIFLSRFVIMLLFENIYVSRRGRAVNCSDCIKG